MNFRPQNRLCFAFNKGACKCQRVGALTLTSASSATIGHPNTRCFQRSSHEVKPQTKSTTCYRCGQKGHIGYFHKLHDL